MACARARAHYTTASEIEDRGWRASNSSAAGSVDVIQKIIKNNWKTQSASRSSVRPLSVYRGAQFPWFLPQLRHRDAQSSLIRANKYWIVAPARKGKGKKDGRTKERTPGELRKPRDSDSCDSDETEVKNERRNIRQCRFSLRFAAPFRWVFFHHRG